MPEPDFEQPYYLACNICGQPHEMVPMRQGTIAHCVRCGSVLARSTRDSLTRTFAFALAAMMFYLPANLFPILRLDLYGSTSENTVSDGVVLFYRDGEYIMAVIVLLASIVIPFVKIVGLLFLVLTTHFRMSRGKRFRTRAYRFIDVIGRWAMLDVFVLAIWVAVVKLQRLGSVSPARGLLPFGMVVVLTLFSAASFDPQLIWENEPLLERERPSDH